MACSLGARPPPPSALQDARDDQQRQRVRNAAEQGADGEQRDAGHVEALAAEAVGEPAGDGQDDGAGDEVAGEDPGGFFWLAPSEPAMCGRATLAMEVSRTSMNVASVTVSATAQGLWWGFQTAGGLIVIVAISVS